MCDWEIDDDDIKPPDCQKRLRWRARRSAFLFTLSVLIVFFGMLAVVPLAMSLVELMFKGN